MVGYSDVLIGLQFGDEGKARVVDQLAKDYDIIARFNGGPNAGHTIQNKDKKIVVHQIPSGIFYPDKDLYVGSGCVVNLEKMIKEFDELKQLDVDLKDRLHISSMVTLIQPHHILLDAIAGSEIGTTKNGIGPAYADRAMRMFGKRYLNIRLGDLLHDSVSSFKYMHENILAGNYNLNETDISVSLEKIKRALDRIAPFIEEDSLYLDRQVKSGKNVLFEGAQSFMLDVVKGTVPDVTSSHTITGHAYVGGDLSPKYHRSAIGVAKAIVSRVGCGPFVSEIGGKKSENYCKENDWNAHTATKEKDLDIEKLLSSDDDLNIGIALRIIGKEYGSSTGRPRRIGMLDLVQLFYAVNVCGIDELFINKIDLVGDFSRTKYNGIPVVTGYNLHGKNIDYVPGTIAEINAIIPNLEIFPAFQWTEKNYGNCTSFISKIEDYLGLRVKGIGIGPLRDEFVKLY